MAHPCRSAAWMDECRRRRYAHLGSTEQRFWNRVDKTESGCWLWTSYTDPGGYGRMSVEGREVQAHRWSYEQARGPIPAGMQLDHLCRVRRCVNPAHLEVVTPRENVLRGVGFAAENHEKTHCPRGHEYTPENTYRRASGWRRCRICTLANNAAGVARREAAKRAK